MGVQTDGHGVLEMLYDQAGFDEQLFVREPLDQKGTALHRIVEGYRTLIREYPAAELESLGGLPRELWEGLKRLGIFGLNIPEQYGGAGLSLGAYLAVIEEMARSDMALALIPTAHLSIGIKGLLLFGSEEQKQRYLPGAASGEMIFAYALTEPEVGSDAQHIRARARLSDDETHFILNGDKTYITNGGYAGGLTVFAQVEPKENGSMGAFIVETGWPGVTVGEDMPKMGLRISSTTSIRFRDVRVPVENLLGAAGDGFMIAMTILNYGRLCLGAASTGVMKQSVEDMSRRAWQRKQFGLPIKDFELIQEKLVQAEVYADVTAAMTRFTACLLETSPKAGVAIESSHTKLFGTTRAWQTLYDALQVAGGAGYIATQPYEKRMRDFRVTTVFEGTTEIHSIYPPLYLARMLRKKLGSPGNTVKLLVGLLAYGLKRVTIPVVSDDPLIEAALRYCRKATTSVRRKLAFGLARHGKEIVQKEFFLRDITEISMYLFGVLSLVAAIMAKERHGLSREGDMSVLAYFLEEAKGVRRIRGRFARTRKEILHQEVFRVISSRARAQPDALENRLLRPGSGEQNVSDDAGAKAEYGNAHRN